MDHMTMRSMFPREAVLGLLEEPEFADCMTLIEQRDMKPVPDLYMAVFVVETEPVPECGLRLRPVSTTAIGITRTSSKRLLGEELHLADKSDTPAMELLRAHFRAEEAFVNKAVNDIVYRLPYWRNHYRNGAGDLNTAPEITIEDRGAGNGSPLWFRSTGSILRPPLRVAEEFHLGRAPNWIGQQLVHQ